MGILMVDGQTRFLLMAGQATIPRVGGHTRILVMYGHTAIPLVGWSHSDSSCGW